MNLKLKLKKIKIKRAIRPIKRLSLKKTPNVIGGLGRRYRDRTKTKWGKEFILDA
jgi:hypothetical protein